MVRVAIPVANDLLGSHFDACSHFMIYEIDKKSVKRVKTDLPAYTDIEELSEWLETNGITDIIVHGIDQPSLTYFSGTKINLFLGVSINTPEFLIEEYLKGSLQSDAHNSIRI
ncbi:MAG: hypothetical protein JEZ03_08730 [Bacteroidales bacterium]|nr:hypothetical protein [Bacteroidales bacterium]